MTEVNVDNNRVFTANLRLTSVGYGEDFMLDIEWGDPFPDVVRESEENGAEVPASYRAMLSIIEKFFGSFNQELKAEVNEEASDSKTIVMDVTPNKVH